MKIPYSSPLKSDSHSPLLCQSPRHTPPYPTYFISFLSQRTRYHISRIHQPEPRTIQITRVQINK